MKTVNAGWDRNRKFRGETMQVFLEISVLYLNQPRLSWLKGFIGSLHRGVKRAGHFLRAANPGHLVKNSWSVGFSSSTSSPSKRLGPKSKWAMLLTQPLPSTYSLSRHLCFVCLVALSYCFLTAFSFTVFWLIPVVRTADSFFLGLSLKLHMRKGVIRRLSPIKRRTHLWEEQCRTTKRPVSDSSGSVTHPWFQQLGLGVGGQVVQSLMT